MPKLFALSIVTPEKIVFDKAVSSLVVPAALGYMGVLADHTPLIAILKSGIITIQDDSGKTTHLYPKEKGFIEVLKNKVTILLPSL